MEYKIGFVLGGGGTRGFAHLGIIEGLMERGIRPDIISGVSAGAISGAFISAGKSPREIHELLKRKNLFRYTNLQLPTNGLLRLDGLQKVLEKEIPYQRIEDLPIPLFIGLSNITIGRMEYHNQGPLARSILASASIPVLFAPVEIDGNLYADGGLLENLPAEPLAGKCKHLVVSNVSPLQKPFEVKNIIQMVIRTFHVGIHARVQEAKRLATLYLEPTELTDFDLLNVSHADQAFEIGYKLATSLDDSEVDKLRV